jgi:molybdopterin-containing oxidoreductase family iron-sulfur binding subunit
MTIERDPVVDERAQPDGSRRTFLKVLGAGAALVSAGCTGTSIDKILQQHYTTLTDADKQRIFRRIEDETRSRTGVRVEVGDPPPIEGVAFAFALNLSACNGNRRCVEACARENNLPDDIRYIQVLELEKGSFDLERADLYYDRPKVPAKDKFYLPVQCQQCENPPCVRACPVGATWKEPDGLVVVDYDWCIGCRFCMTACPYFARHFNWSDPSVRPEAINPRQAYLSNRIRQRGVVEKCTFCLQRTRAGRLPACLEACPTGARKFGNLLDPDGDIHRIVSQKRVYVLKEDLGTVPRFYYYFG